MENLLLLRSPEVSLCLSAPLIDVQSSNLTLLGLFQSSKMFLLLLQQNIAQSFHSPVVLIFLAAIAVGLLYVLWREVRKIPAKLFTLMATAFVDMLGLLMIIPLLPFYVQSLSGSASTFVVAFGLVKLSHS